MDTNECIEIEELAAELYCALAELDAAITVYAELLP